MADEDPDDPQLKSLRAVWLAMRDSDEEPPDSGVSALMAAARSQASMMAAAKAPWWKRMFEQLRRPPVLALASLLVVVGVGALLASHHDAIEKAPTTAPVQEKELPPANLDVGGAATLPTAPGTAKDDQPHDKQAPDGEPPVHRHLTPPTRPSAGKAATPSVHSDPRPEPAFQTGEGQALDAKAPNTETATPVPPSRVLVDQLAAQAKQAAQRGDCENAKAIATRIAGQDAAYYRDHVARELASCLSTPTAPAAVDAR